MSLIILDTNRNIFYIKMKKERDFGLCLIEHFTKLIIQGQSVTFHEIIIKSNKNSV